MDRGDWGSIESIFGCGKLKDEEGQVFDRTDGVGALSEGKGSLVEFAPENDGLDFELILNMVSPLILI